MVFQCSLVAVIPMANLRKSKSCIAAFIMIVLERFGYAYDLSLPCRAVVFNEKVKIMGEKPSSKTLMRWVYVDDKVDEGAYRQWPSSLFLQVQTLYRRRWVHPEIQNEQVTNQLHHNLFLFLLQPEHTKALEDYAQRQAYAHGTQDIISELSVDKGKSLFFGLKFGAKPPMEKIEKLKLDKASMQNGPVSNSYCYTSWKNSDNRTALVFLARARERSEVNAVEFLVKILVDVWSKSLFNVWS